ncbi:hypothetical protein CAPTEDRAFT_223544 [Capitella teleta]|uniref:Deltamethrin resistance protein prag01 domain-containing protein n=1 Tax=Capitella teleta TaxID=283909 RepID=R7UJR6_CAPTE|nr:hypothetical protein CAPTEDRAFT_223544 [Capitella teleta]|eukprot:ELU06353.1 hypothetical protein CAPTEDRAFT_223544 [Capitella teleta]
MRQKIFPIGCIETQNGLLEKIISASSLNDFKRAIDNHWIESRFDIHAVRAMSGGHHHGWKPMVQVVKEARGHMDDLPVPQGSFQENYAARNRKWNMQLIVSMALFTGIWSYVILSGDLKTVKMPKYRDVSIPQD